MKTTHLNNRNHGLALLLWLVIAGAVALVVGIGIGLVIYHHQSTFERWRDEWIWTEPAIQPPLPPIEIDEDNPMLPPVRVDFDWSEGS